jgi:hypothetical protein
LFSCLGVEFLSLPRVGVVFTLPFPQFALLTSVPRVQLSVITILGSWNCVAVSQFALLSAVQRVRHSLLIILGRCDCVAVGSFLGVPSP